MEIEAYRIQHSYDESFYLPISSRSYWHFKEKNGEVIQTEVKSSQTAPLTRNQGKAHPQLETNGGTIRGIKGEVIGLPSGTRIEPTKVQIIRPDDLTKKQF